MYEDPTEDNTTFKCNFYTKHNKTHIIYGGYEGIPETLLINFLTWLGILLLFAILRKKAWNYGRIALVQRNENRGLVPHQTHYNVWTQLFYGDVDGGGSAAKYFPDQVSIDSQDSCVQIDRGFCSWMIAIFRIKDAHILRRSGVDAVQYLSFQRYVIVYLIILTVISIGIILPVNFSGELEGTSEKFGHTTLTNLEPQSNLLWVHVVLSILLLPLGVFFMRHFSTNLHLENRSSVSSTLLITDIPKDKCNKSRLLQHFQEAYPDVVIHDIQLAFNIKELIKLDKKRDAICEAKLFAESYLKETNDRLMIRPYRCSWMLKCCSKCGCRKTDAIDYYTKEELFLRAEIDNVRLLAMEQPLGVCFITFQTEAMAYKVYKDHQHSCKCGTNPPASSVSVSLEPYRWGVTSAPQPEDIHWQNLSSNSENWYLKAFCINFCLFFVLFFLTTPFIIIHSIDKMYFTNQIEKLSPLLSQFLPTLMLWTVAALLPVIVSYSDQFVSHWTRSAENHSIMRKTFMFLLFMIVILPSLGLTSAKAFFEFAMLPANQTSLRWECIYLPDNGAFYVNYVITAAFIGTALELIRFPELFMYMLRLCCARSKAEQNSVRKAILWEFPFGVEYAWVLLIFALTVIYSLTTPLITPFGLLYMCLKHCVDRYNIYFAYGPSKISIKIHTTAINYVVASIILLQVLILSFIILRLGMQLITIVSIVCFAITTLIYIAQMFFNLFQGVSPIFYSRFKERSKESDDEAAAPPTSPGSQVKFLPDVLNCPNPQLRERHPVHNSESGSGATGFSPSRNGRTASKSYGTTEEQDELEATNGNVIVAEVETRPLNLKNQHDLYQDYGQPKDTIGVASQPI